MPSQFILCVDDEPDNLELVQEFLERSIPGVVVDVCMTVAGAELMLNQHCYDLVITDINLRGELGTAIAENLLERDPGQPIYLFTEYALGDEAHPTRLRQELERLGVPYGRKFSDGRFDEFLDTVRGLLRKRPCPESEGIVARTDRAQDLPRVPPDHKVQLISPLVKQVRAMVAGAMSIG